jgi:hypothetical protein
VVQGHACGEGGREHGRCRLVCGLRTVRQTRPDVKSMCARVDIAAWRACVYIVGREDGSTDDADVCGLRTVRHTRPEVESMCVHMWAWLLERHAYTS